MASNEPDLTDEIEGALQDIAKEYRGLVENDFEAPVRAKLWLFNRLDREGQDVLRSVLIKHVLQNAETLGDSDCEDLHVLVVDNDEGVARALLRIVESHGPGASAATERWKDGIVFALIQMGFKPGLRAYLEYIRNNIDDGEARSGILRVIPALVRVAPDVGVDVISSHLDLLVSRHGQDTDRPSLSYAYNIVDWCLRTDGHLLGHLVRKVRERDETLGLELSALLKEQLRSPLFVDGWGEAALQEIGRELP